MDPSLMVLSVWSISWILLLGCSRKKTTAIAKPRLPREPPARRKESSGPLESRGSLPERESVKALRMAEGARVSEEEKTFPEEATRRCHRPDCEVSQRRNLMGSLGYDDYREAHETATEVKKDGAKCGCQGERKEKEMDKGQKEEEMRRDLSNANPKVNRADEKKKEERKKERKKEMSNRGGDMAILNIIKMRNVNSKRNRVKKKDVKKKEEKKKEEKAKKASEWAYPLTTTPSLLLVPTQLESDRESEKKESTTKKRMEGRKVEINDKSDDTIEDAPAVPLKNGPSYTEVGCELPGGGVGVSQKTLKSSRKKKGRSNEKV